MSAPIAAAPFMVPAQARVRAVATDAPDTFTMHIDAPEGHRFDPGQFSMLYAFGAGEAPISISGDPADTGALIYTIREAGIVTGALRRIEAGQMVGLRGPFGHGWPLAAARGADLLLIAGGLGLAPLRPAVYHALRNRGDYGRVALLVGARTPEGLLYPDELARWRSEGAIEVLTTVDRAAPGWDGQVGVVPALVPAAGVRPDRAIAFVCGPEVMMRFTIRELARKGIPAARTYVSMERNMKCAIGLCGHCQYGPAFLCKDGPVLRYDRVQRTFALPEI